MTNHRFTGCWPPLHLLQSIVNWEWALDEEEVPDQDETTLRPCEDQTCITPETDYAAGTMTFADGSTVTVMMEVHDDIDAIEVLETDEDSWIMRRRNISEPWRFYQPTEDAAKEYLTARSHSSLFPAVVRTRAAQQHNNQPIEVTIHELLDSA